MSNFTVKNGVLKKYDGNEPEIDIPDGIKRIGEFAFSRNIYVKKIRIPDGVTSIDDGAFSCCRNLTEITVPDTVTRIGANAFSFCVSLKSIYIPKNVTALGRCVFAGCAALKEISVDCECKKYHSEGCCIIETKTKTLIAGCANSIIPSDGSVAAIGRYAFSNCAGLKSIDIPDGVESIGEFAFLKCADLFSVNLPDSVAAVGSRAFCSCAKLAFISMRSQSIGILDTAVESDICVECEQDGKSRIFAVVYDKTVLNPVKTLAKPGDMMFYDAEIVNNGPLFNYKTPVRLIAAAARLADPAELGGEFRYLYAEYLRENVRKAVSAAIRVGRPRLIKAMFDNGAVAEKDQKAVRKLLSESADEDIRALAACGADRKTPVPGPEKPERETADPLSAEYEEKFHAINGDKIIGKMKLTGRKLPAVLLKNGVAAPEVLFMFIAASYADTEVIRFNEEADKAAALYNYSSLCAALDELSDRYDLFDYPSLIPVFCRYASASQIKRLCLMKRDVYDPRIRKAEEVIVKSLPLSDTRAAAVWLQRNHGLDEYAKLRGVTVDKIYSDIIYDFGFDENFIYRFDLGTTVIEACLTPDLKIELYDTVKQKTVKSLPKKGADPELYKRLSDEYDDMRQNLKKAVRMKTDQLFADYLDKNAASASDWQTAYMKNPLLKKIGGMIVWEQGKTTFRTEENGLVTSDGKKYALTGDPVTVAHPMDMEPSDVSAWQKYFMDRKIIQPFPQIWEHVYDCNEIREDRYKDCKIRMVFLGNQARRGIFSSLSDLHIEGFITSSEISRDSTDGYMYVSIQRIKPKAWNRRANNVTAYLDRITVFGRVRKDDVSVIEHLPSFTLAQIMEMIKAAEESHAVNVAALLLDYKNKTYPDYDPMAEFTLDW